ncbi:MAG: OmpL47-type beta-barrel domain-containing protein [Candidatus Poseidoniaceae archaeon]
MGRQLLCKSFLLVSLLMLAFVPLDSVNFDSLGQEDVVKMSSSLSASFSNGPSENDVIKGTHTLTFSTSGTGTVDSILIEISSNSADWTTVANLTSAPFIKHMNSNNYENDSYQLRATLWDSDANADVVFYSGNFSIANQQPLITEFTILNPIIGDGSSSTQRMWFNTPADGTLEFRYSVSDDDFDRASLSNAPGPGSPALDSGNSLNYGWDWSSGAFQEGTWNPRLTVYDDSGLSNSQTIFMGIDRTGPTMSEPTLSSSGWQSSENAVISDLQTSADDGLGSGVHSVEYSLDNQQWTATTQDSVSIAVSEGTTQVWFRAVDKIGNTGASISTNISSDFTAPEGIKWIIDELTTSRIGVANITYEAVDDLSGIDESSSYIQYGFDSNGVGTFPDLTGSWLTVGTSGLDGTIGLASWATKSHQFLLVKAVVVDNAGNEFISSTSSFQILPGLDIGWNASQTTIDKLVVRPGQSSGLVEIESVIESNQPYGGSINVRLEIAPADRLSDVNWSVMETRILEAGTLADSTESLTWNYTVTSPGQMDIRIVIDATDIIDEYDETNNAAYFVVTGADISPGLVPSFAPSLVLVFIAGIIISILQRKSRD